MGDRQQPKSLPKGLKKPKPPAAPPKRDPTEALHWIINGKSNGLHPQKAQEIIDYIEALKKALEFQRMLRKASDLTREY